MSLTVRFGRGGFQHRAPQQGVSEVDAAARDPDDRLALQLGPGRGRGDHAADGAEEGILLRGLVQSGDQRRDRRRCGEPLDPPAEQPRQQPVRHRVTRIGRIRRPGVGRRSRARQLDQGQGKAGGEGHDLINRLPVEPAGGAIDHQRAGGVRI